jgi:hypothetical protein
MGGGFSAFDTRPASPAVIWAGDRKCLRVTFNELVQWMVPDPSLDRQDRWGLKLT